MTRSYVEPERVKVGGSRRGGHGDGLRVHLEAGQHLVERFQTNRSSDARSRVAVVIAQCVWCVSAGTKVGRAEFFWVQTQNDVRFVAISKESARKPAILGPSPACCQSANVRCVTFEYTVHRIPSAGLWFPNQTRNINLITQVFPDSLNVFTSTHDSDPTLKSEGRTTPRRA